jgi:predicted alpha/beta superfamily hydrolase
MKTSSLLFILFICNVVNLSAQDGYSVIHDSIQSKILNQNRKVSIFLPEGYDTVNTRFPVIYVLDGEGRDQHTVPTARFLFMNHKMPQAIIVGVMNIDRNHDFLPDSSKAAPTGGGADNFIQFFDKELFPYINKNFKTEEYKVLIGHSYGGLFAMHVLLTQPDLFDSYIAIDPSIWYNNVKLVMSAEMEFAKTKNWDRSIFITGREGGGLKDMGIVPMDSLLKTSAPKDLNWKITAYSDEDHGSVTFKSVYDGLRFIFDTGGALKVFPDAGIIPDGRSYDIYVSNINSGIRYTTDGTEPIFNSPQCTDKIQLTGPCTLKIKNVTKKYKNFPSSTFIYRAGEFMQGQKSVKSLKPGLKYSCYEGVWDSLPDFSKLKPVKTGIASNIDLSMAVKKDSFALKFEGYVHIEEEDLYYMWITSDDGSEIYLNNMPILKNDGVHSADLPKVAVVPLSPGYYSIKVKYFEKSGSQSLAAGMIKVNENPSAEPFSKEQLFYKK